MIAKELSSKDSVSRSINKNDLEFLLVKEKDYIFFKGLIILRQSVFSQVLRILLVVFLFLERFSFIVIVYKTKCSNYVLLLTVVILNAIILYSQQLKNQKKVTDKMSHLFKINSTQNAPFLVIIIVGALDMGFAFCLYWPADIIPILVLVCQMQLFIPLDTLFSKLVCGRKEKTKHVLVALFTLFGTTMSLISFLRNADNNSEKYILLFVLGQLMNVLSFQLKESIVRNILVNQTSFQF